MADQLGAVDLRYRGDEGIDRGPRPRPPDGVARLEFSRRGAATDLARLFQQGSLRVLRPNVPAGEPACAVLLNTSGGLVGGDVLEIEARAAPAAAVMITTQAAEKVYRSAGAVSAVDVRLRLTEDAWLEWLPQETILFDRARIRRRLLELAVSARLLAADLLVFGRRARGERFRRGLFHDRWEVRSGGRLVWADALRLADDPGAQLDAPFGFAGAGAAGTAVYVAPDAGDRLELARALIDHPGVRSGATCTAPVLIVRWLGEDPASVRHALQHFCARFRHAAAGLPERVPAIWRIGACACLHLRQPSPPIGQALPSTRPLSGLDPSLPEWHGICSRQGDAAHRRDEAPCVRKPARDLTVMAHGGSGRRGRR